MINSRKDVLKGDKHTENPTMGVSQSKQMHMVLQYLPNSLYVKMENGTNLQNILYRLYFIIAEKCEASSGRIK